jgi:hypothetical protein
MEKTLNLKMPGVMELGKEEMKEVEGGDPSGGLLLGISAALLAIYNLGKAIGKELYYETH